MKKRQEISILKKAAQKLLLIWAHGGETSTGPVQKSFLLLFFKKEALPFHS
jgi:hypothetical protein